MNQVVQQSLKPKGMPEVRCLFPVPVYFTSRDLDLVVENEKEKKEIVDIIKEGMTENYQNLQSDNSHIFDTKLHNLKKFIEGHIKTYVKNILNPVEELDFYITQSWINLNKPGHGHFKHSHANSILSGIYYIATVENDGVSFHDPNAKIKHHLAFESKEDERGEYVQKGISQSAAADMRVNTGDLLIFPSWLEHGVERNPKATTNRISLAFNTFVNGTFGCEQQLNELILS